MINRSGMKAYNDTTIPLLYIVSCSLFSKHPDSAIKAPFAGKDNDVALF